ncbi:hypothetical protein FD755_016327, partial [Muntiacus reevesi]
EPTFPWPLPSWQDYEVDTSAYLSCYLHLFPPWSRLIYRRLSVASEPPQETFFPKLEKEKCKCPIWSSQDHSSLLLISLTRLKLRTSGTSLMVQWLTLLTKNKKFRNFPGYPEIKTVLPLQGTLRFHMLCEICLNVRDPPTNIVIIPEKQVKPEWRLPKLNHRFVTRSELDKMPNNSICDVIGVLVFVGRVQRSKKKDSREDFWSYRWIHIADGTSEQPFIVELFSTSQPEIFEHIYPMTHFMCTQLKVVKNDAQVPKLLYLTTTNESHIFLTGHKGQPCTNDAKVKNFIQWIKAKNDSGEVKNTVMGGYYPYPPVPETFLKYSSSLKVESLLTALSEVKVEIEDLQYREQKRIAIQGIITVIKYVPRNSATESASASETLRNANRPSTSEAARKESQSQEKDGKRHHDDGSGSSQCCRSAHASSSPVTKKKIMQTPSGKHGLPFPSPEYLLNPGIKLMSPSWQTNYLPLSHQKNFCFRFMFYGLNHEIAIDVAFLPMYSLQDIRTSQVDTLLTCMNYSCVYPQGSTANEKVTGSRGLAGDIIKAVAKMDRSHVICILDICSLGNNKAEVYLHKIYEPNKTS